MFASPLRPRTLCPRADAIIVTVTTLFTIRQSISFSRELGRVYNFQILISNPGYGHPSSEFVHATQRRETTDGSGTGHGRRFRAHLEVADFGQSSLAFVSRRGHLGPEARREFHTGPPCIASR
jgi:hypothetical protein